MNTDQIGSLIRSGLKLLSAFLIAHGLNDTAGWLNAPDVIGALTLAGSLWWSHANHKPDPLASGGSTPSPPPNAGTGTGGSSKTAGVFLLCAGLSAALLSACQSTPQQVTYQAAGTATVSVDTAMHLWGAYVAANHPSTNAELVVKASYEKYQAAMALACDAGSVYAATAVTNATAGAQMQLALQQAISTAGQDLADLERLIASFGVKIN